MRTQQLIIEAKVANRESAKSIAATVVSDNLAARSKVSKAEEKYYWRNSACVTENSCKLVIRTALEFSDTIIAMIREEEPEVNIKVRYVKKENIHFSKWLHSLLDVSNRVPHQFQLEDVVIDRVKGVSWEIIGIIDDGYECVNTAGITQTFRKDQLQTLES